jgi:RHS repeat-associated protein
MLGEEMAGRTNEAFAGMRKGLQEIRRQEQAPIEIYFYHCDHLGTPIALTDRQGQIVWAAKYDPWGNIQEEYNPYNINQDIRLPGQHHDWETGLYYNRHRYYDPKIGAYINQDLIGLMGAINLYEYPKNPLIWMDLLGLSSIWYTDRMGNLVGPIDSNTLLPIGPRIEPPPPPPLPDVSDPCVQKYLIDNYGYPGGFMATIGNLQQYLPSDNSDWKSSLGEGTRLASEKTLATKGPMAIGERIGGDLGAKMFTRFGLASGVVETVATALTFFGTPAMRLAQLNCRCRK